MTDVTVCGRGHSLHRDHDAPSGGDGAGEGRGVRAAPTSLLALVRGQPAEGGDLPARRQLKEDSDFAVGVWAKPAAEVMREEGLRDAARDRQQGLRAGGRTTKPGDELGEALGEGLGKLRFRVSRTSHAEECAKAK